MTRYGIVCFCLLSSSIAMADSVYEIRLRHAAELQATEKITLPAHLRKPGITNSLGMRLAYVPSGKFGMGSPLDEPHREAQEILHEVELTRAFYLGMHQVTNFLN